MIIRKNKYHKHGPLTRYVNLWFAHEPGMPGTFPRHRLQRKPLVSDFRTHHNMCVTHVPWCMSGSLTHNGWKNLPGIPGACAIRNIAYLVRSPWEIGFNDIYTVSHGIRWTSMIKGVRKHIWCTIYYAKLPRCGTPMWCGVPCICYHLWLSCLVNVVLQLSSLILCQIMCYIAKLPLDFILHIFIWRNIHGHWSHCPVRLQYYNQTLQTNANK